MARNFPLRIVILAAEAAPFAKVGGLGDVISALPKALTQPGVEPTVIIPAYRSVQTCSSAIHSCNAVPGFDIPMASSYEHAEVLQTRMNGTDADVYMIGSRKYFDRDGIYEDPATGEGYPDEMERFIFFMKSAIELIIRLKVPVDVVHCHDYHTALVPGLLKTYYREHPFFSSVGTLLTIHNMAYQGIYSKEALDYAGIASEHFYPASPFEYWGRVNFMKAGIELADKVNTVSPTYSIEIRTNPEFGMGLEGVLQGRKDDFTGIVNGIDYDEWNPQIDPLIPAHFSAGDISGKEKCKRYLQRRFQLPIRKRVPLIGMVSRLTDQKGFDLITEAIKDIMALDLQLIILGTGQKKYHELFRDIASRYAGKIGLCLSFDNDLAHKIEAGCDMFLMPSKFEPCGLNQLYSLRYGTIPIVRRTGGLADTVIPYDREKGTGFTFSGYSAEEMMSAIHQALKIYSSPPDWNALVIRAMSQDWSWSRSAQEYLELYRSIRFRVQGSAFPVKGYQPKPGTQNAEP
jgi:starch synthase